MKFWKKVIQRTSVQCFIREQKQIAEKRLEWMAVLPPNPPQTATSTITIINSNYHWWVLGLPWLTLQDFGRACIQSEDTIKSRFINRTYSGSSWSLHPYFIWTLSRHWNSQYYSNRLSSSIWHCGSHEMGGH